MKKSTMTQQPPPLDVNKTTLILNDSGGKIFEQGFVLRKVSKFISGIDEDSILPIPVFYDKETGKILGESLPPGIKSDYDTF
jgi:hypothetical protein